MATPESHRSEGRWPNRAPADAEVPVRSIERAFAVLAALAGGPLGVTGIADRVGLPKSTVARLLAALAGVGVVEQVPDGTDYRIGTRLGELAGAGRGGRSLVALARPELVELTRRTGEAAGLALLDEESVQYVDHVETPNPVRVRDWTGVRAPLHAVPSGIVLLASFPQEALERYLARPLERFTERTVVDPTAIRERLVRAAVEGCAWGIEEYAEGISSVAAPIADEAGRMVASLHVHGPSYRFPRGGPGPASVEARAIADELVAAAARLSARLRSAATG